MFPQSILVSQRLLVLVLKLALATQTFTFWLLFRSNRLQLVSLVGKSYGTPVKAIVRARADSEASPVVPNGDASAPKYPVAQPS
jgi:hypothetical protein